MITPSNRLSLALVVATVIGASFDREPTVRSAWDEGAQASETPTPAERYEQLVRELAETRKRIAAERRARAGEPRGDHELALISMGPPGASGGGGGRARRSRAATTRCP